MENTGDSIWSVDRDHRLITLNSAFKLAMEASTGNEPQVGQLPAEVFAPEDVEWYQELYDRTLTGDRNVALRTDEVDGQLRYFELYANPIQSLEGVSGAVFFGTRTSRVGCARRRRCTPPRRRRTRRTRRRATFSRT